MVVVAGQLTVLDGLIHEWVKEFAKKASPLRCG